MNPIHDPIKLADAQLVADKLKLLPETARIYIAGYAEGIATMAHTAKHKPTDQNAS